MRLRLALPVLMLAAALPALAAHVPGQVLVVLDHPDALRVTANGQLAAASPGLDAALVTRGFVRGTTIVHKIGPLVDRDRRYLLLQSDDPDLDEAEAAAALASRPEIAVAAVNGLRQLFLVPNDPYFGNQWHLQPGNSAGIHLAEAWDLGLGVASTVIAIMDTGVDWSHPDLAGSVWTNSGEVAGNGLDDDGNGYVDDVRGWDFGNHDADARPHTTLEQGLDVGFHGTHCAGIAAAVTDNGVGVAGAAGGCRLMPLKIVDSNSAFTDAAITEAFLYAIDNGADVVSMSFGGPDEGGAAAFFQNLIDQATAADIVCVAAAGNNNDASLVYPAACDGVISVGSTSNNGQRSSFSSYGNWVTVNAPGEHIWSTIQTNYEFDFLTGLLYTLLYEWDGTNPYMYCDGTSMACPLVAGVCGLIHSASAGLTPAQVRQHLIDTGDMAAYDQPLGVKVNAFAAIQALQSTPVHDTPAVAGLRLQCAPNPFNPLTTVTYAVPVAGSVELAVYDAAGRRVRALVDGTRPAGVATVRWDGHDDGGRRCASGPYVLRLRAGERVRQMKVLLVK